MSLAPGTPIGKYVVRCKLAEGGMAEVYLASALGPGGFNKDVVIKRIRPYLSTDQSFVQMFIAEARVACRLNHPNIVQIFDFDRQGDAYYLAMEYVRGKSLWEIRQRAEALRLPMRHTMVAHVGAEVARALHYVHRLTDRESGAGLVHRDVSPHNILVSFDGAVKLTDFGIAKVGTQGTAPGTLKGKFAYMAPEQAHGLDVDGRTDVFALGVVLWEMLTGVRLFRGDNDMALLRSVREDAIEPPRKVNPSISPALEEIVMRALARERHARIPNAQELERALAQFVLATATSLEDTDLRGYSCGLFPDEVSRVTGDPGTPVTAQPPAPAPPPAPAARPPQRATSEALDSATTQPVVRPVPPASRAPAATHSLSHPSLLRAVRPGRSFALLLLGGVAVGCGLAVAAYLAFAPRSQAGEGAPQIVAAPLIGHPEPVPVLPAAAPPPIKLRPAEPASEAASAPAVPGPAPDPLEAGADPAAQPSAPGTLVLRARPWAEVFVDGASRGTVDLHRLSISLPAGRHTLQFKHPARNSRVLVVDVPPGKSVAREFDAIPR